MAGDGTPDGDERIPGREPVGDASSGRAVRELSDDPQEDPDAGVSAPDDGWSGPDLWTLAIGYGLVVVCFLVYFLIHLDRPNDFLHFVLQAQAWLNGNTAIPMPNYQDVMPVVDADGAATGRGIIPFPPLPAWFLLPFVAIWHEDTNQQLLSTIFGAVDVGIAYWMLGRLPIRSSVRALTALFLGLGTVLFYTSAIGSTWFWAHVVAVACLLFSVGLALAADPEATEPLPLRAAGGAIRGVSLPGRWLTLGLLAAVGILFEGLLRFADSGASAASLALIGLGICIVATILAAAVAGRWGALAGAALLVSIVVGVPGLFLLAVFAPGVTVAVDLALLLLVAIVVGFAVSRRDSFERAQAALWATITSPESMQIAAGVFFGLAVTARLTILFGFPFLILVGGGGSWMRRGLLAGAGAAVPLVALLVVTYATSGELFNPAYDFLYHNELLQYGYVLNYHADWSISDIRYVPQNLVIMLLNGPEIAPDFVGIAGPNYGTATCLTTDAARGLFDSSCPLAMPNAIGTSLLFSSPAFLLAPFAWRPLKGLELDRATVGASIAVIAIAFVNLMHFSQGWVQFGYRFSNDFVPFALVLVALGVSRLGRLWPAVLLVVLSIVINFWGTIWGSILGW